MSREKTVIVVVDPAGNVHMVFGGFQGRACYQEAEKIRARLQALGVAVNCTQCEPVASDTSMSEEMPHAIRGHS